MQTINLCGEWLFKSDNENVWRTSCVPSCQYSDLLNIDKIADPFFGTNEKDCFWAGNCAWQYKKTFLVSEEFLKQFRIDLVYKQLDTLCKVYINSELAFSSSNMHLGGRKEIKDFLHLGENEIFIEFANPVEYIEKKQAADKMPKNMNGLSGVPHIRKAQCHFGWDWGPILPVVGITQDIWLEGYNFIIDDFFVTQKHHDGIVTLNIDVLGSNLFEPATMLFIDLASPDGKVIKNKAQALKNKNSFVFDIKNPALWWTNDLFPKEQQPLYEIRAYIVKDEKVEYKLFKKIGLRTITLCRDEDEFGRQFQFKLNGVPLFIKGANWIPPDSFPDRFNTEKLSFYIHSAKYANMNMLRVWGGGYYESDAFYDACDSAGILVWQDFCFACAPYPFYDDNFKNSVLSEIKYNVLRLKHHASLALWCGNNEIEAMSLVWAANKKLHLGTRDFFYKDLPEYLKTLDSETPYIPGSPTGLGFMEKVGSDDYGDTHLWHVWHGLRPLTYYRKRYTRFCSEFGLESLCDMQTIKAFAKNAELSLKSPVFKAHQKCLSGNDKMLFYMSTRFSIPKSFADVVYLSQLIQSECVSDATEHWRRNRGRCNGSMYWQFNDCWPVTSWSSIDYFERYKALQYRARHFNNPQSVSVKNQKTTAEIFVLNDKTTGLEATLEYKLISFLGETLLSKTMPVSALPTSSQSVVTLDFKKQLKQYKHNCVLVVKLFEKENLLSEKTVLFAPEKKLDLPKDKIKLKMEFKNGLTFIKISSSAYKRFVQLELQDNATPFSDNYFDLIPNEEKSVIIKIPDGMSPRDFEENLSVRSLAEIENTYSAAHDFFLRQKIRFNPINIGQYIAYSVV